MKIERRGEGASVRRPLGVAVIGSGTIGRLRATVLARNPAVGFIAVCDLVEERARAVAGEIGAAYWGTDHLRAIGLDEVDAVIVASGEDDHFAPSMAAIELGKPLLVEKPFVVKPTEAQILIDAAERRGVPVFVGYTQRFRRRYMNAREQIDLGRLGELTTALGKIVVTRAVGQSVMERSRGTSPSINTLTYVIDLLLWYLEGYEPLRLSAVGAEGAFMERYGVHDSTWAVVKLSRGCVATVGVSWEPPEFHPAATAQMAIELFGRDGCLSIEDGHRESVLVSSHPIPAPYTPQHSSNVGFLGSAMPGDWALGSLHGPMREETDAFVSSVISRQAHPVLATARHAARVLDLCLAIDRAAKTGEVVELDAAPAPQPTVASS